MLEDYDDIVVLISKDGEEIEFIVIAEIAYKGKMYAIMQPVELYADMEEDEAMVFEVETENNENKYLLVLDEVLLDEIFEEYTKLIESMED